MHKSGHRAVFISHASKNFKLADEIRQLIEARGISCWIAPRDIPPGASYGENIADAIEHCCAVIFVMTEQANQSRAVANELELAFRHQRVIIPIRVNHIEPAQSLRFFVSNAQWVDAIHTPLKKRIDVLINIVNAAINNAQMLPPVAESKTLLGSLERSLEGLIRFKMLTAFGVLGVVTVLGLAALFFSSITLSQLEGDQTKIDLDPSTFGLVTLSADDFTLGNCKPHELNLHAAIYVNLQDPNKAGLAVQSRIFSSKGEAFEGDLSAVREFNSPDVQKASICVHEDTSRVVFCMTAEHPRLKKHYAATWTYRIQRDKGAILMVREPSTKLFEGQQAGCGLDHI